MKEYYAELCPHEPNWVHEHLAAERAGYEAGIDSLRRAVHAADKDRKYACLNLGVSAQVATSARLDHLRYAFALVTGTAVSGAEFNARLGKP